MFKVICFSESDGWLMFAEIVKQALDDMINYLGQPIIYTDKSGNTSSVIAVIKAAENQYELGDSQMIDQVAEVSIKASDITPKIGEYICSNGRKYKIFEGPLLDASTLIWRFKAVLIGENL